jgi:hypothetical protein
LINLFEKLEKRDDKSTHQAVSPNADIPTIFEYLIGIAWYLINDRRGDVLSYMNLSLEADLLPRSHAQGGVPDIAYKFDKTDAYPAHTLLIEATLTENTNQRRTEMEPVNRHLGEYMLLNNDKNSYCVFISTFLHPTLVTDFRSWKDRPYYDKDYNNTETPLKILPLKTSELQTILRSNLTYDQLYEIFDSAFKSDKAVEIWYAQDIKGCLESTLNMDESEDKAADKTKT